MQRWAIAAACVAFVAGSTQVSVAVATSSRPRTAPQHLAEILARSPAPEYRRAGSPGMRAAQRYVGERLARAGYRVAALDVPFVRYAVDYRAGRAPLLERVSDGRSFKAESAFYLGRTTGRQGITCTVRRVEEVQPGDCGFIPFASASPEWKNTPFVTARADIDEIVRRGGIGIVVQGDHARRAVFSITVRQSVPAVVADVAETDVLGTRVRLRAMGRHERGRGTNVVGVMRPRSSTAGYVMLLAHGDGWFQAAADNGGGAAAVLRAAELVATRSPGVGVVVAVVDAEEVGLVGSKRLAELLRTTGIPVDGAPRVRMGDLTAVINIDASSARASDAKVAQALVLGGGPVFSWRVFVSSDGSPLGALFATHAARFGVFGAPVGAQAWVSAIGGWRTDAGWFHDAGVPVVWPVAGYPEYHTDVDTLAAVDVRDLENLARAAAATVEDASSLG